VNQPATEMTGRRGRVEAIRRRRAMEPVRAAHSSRWWNSAADPASWPPTRAYPRALGASSRVGSLQAALRGCEAGLARHWF
jgi:hypothetical protein